MIRANPENLTIRRLITSTKPAGSSAVRAGCKAVRAMGRYSAGFLNGPLTKHYNLLKKHTLTKNSFRNHLFRYGNEIILKKIFVQARQKSLLASKIVSHFSIPISGKTPSSNSARARRWRDRRPTHRELTYQLGVAVGTVSRAYSDAKRRVTWSIVVALPLI